VTSLLAVLRRSGAGGWRRAFASLEVRNFRLFWAGQVVSLVGTWAQLTGQSWLVVSDLRGSPLALGTITMLQFLPVLLFSLVAGVVVDRVSKRAFLVGTQVAALAQALALGVLASTGHVALWHVGLLAFCLGMVNAFDSPARQAFIPELVGRELLPNAVALNSIIFNLARIVGPMVAGISIAVVGTASTFFINAATFLPVIAGLLMMRSGELLPAPPAQAAPLWQQVREGLRYALETPPVFRVMLLMAFIGTFGYNFSVVLPLLARYVLGVQSVGFGGLSAAMGVGSILAALALAYRRQAGEGQLLLGAVAFGALLVLLGASHWLLLTVVVLVLVLSPLVASRPSRPPPIKVTLTPAAPASPSSWRPLPLASTHTRSPRLAGASTPASMLVSFSPEASVMTWLLPALSASESAASSPWWARVKAWPSGALNWTWYSTPGVKPSNL